MTLSKDKAHWLAGIQVTANTTDPDRKCGDKKEDAFYLENEEMEGVELAPWIWLLPGASREPIYTDFPARSHTLIDLDATLLARSPIIWGTPAQNMGWLDDVPCVGDHVGETFYTPWSFYLEMRAHGLSRRTNPVMAKHLSNLLSDWGKLLIAFEAKLPVFPDNYGLITSGICVRILDNIGQLGFLEVDDFEDTWRSPSFNGRVWGYTGKKHWLLPILQLFDILKGKDQDADLVAAVKADPEYADLMEKTAKLEWRNQIFGCSWITKLTYTLGKKERDDLAEFPVLNVVNLDWVRSNDPAIHAGMVIFDLDGTLAAFDSDKLLPDAQAWFDKWDGQKPRVAIATNQGGVGLRLWMERDSFGEPEQYPTEQEVRDRVARIVEQTGHADKITILISFRYQSKKTGQWSPHPNWPGEAELEWSEEWRKPGPGMLNFLRRKYRLIGKNRAGIYVGDGEEDEEAARRSPMTFINRDEFFKVSTLEHLGLPSDEEK